MGKFTVRTTQSACILDSTELRHVALWWIGSSSAITLAYALLHFFPFSLRQEHCSKPVALVQTSPKRRALVLLTVSSQKHRHQSLEECLSIFRRLLRSLKRERQMLQGQIEDSCQLLQLQTCLATESPHLAMGQLHIATV